MTKRQYDKEMKNYRKAIAHLERQIPNVNPYTQAYLRKSIAELETAMAQLEREHERITT